MPKQLIIVIQTIFGSLGESAPGHFPIQLIAFPAIAVMKYFEWSINRRRSQSGATMMNLSRCTFSLSALQSALTKCTNTFLSSESRFTEKLDTLYISMEIGYRFLVVFRFILHLDKCWEDLVHKIIPNKPTVFEGCDVACNERNDTYGEDHETWVDLT